MRGNSIPKPHGDKLINRFVTTKRDINETLSVKVTDDLRNDIENIADGIFSPLEGFVGEDEFRSIIQFGRLKNDLPWTIPIILDVDETTATQMKDAVEVILSTDNENFGLIKVEEVYSFDKLDVAKAIYNTTDINHPGVSKTIGMGNRLIGGTIELLARIPRSSLRNHRMNPLETRSEIQKKSWENVVGFQTRNVPHIAHEMLQKARFKYLRWAFHKPPHWEKKSRRF